MRLPQDAAAPPFDAEHQLEAMRDLFGRPDVNIEATALLVGERRYPILDGVIILLDESRYPASVRRRLSAGTGAATTEDFDPDIQFTFGEEWQRFPDILPEHRREFENYFDLVDVLALEDAVVMDLGCGIGRWSHFLQPHVRQLVLVDFSDAIFVARRNLAHAPNALFFMADLKQLPFRAGFADLVVCLGVLHHLPTNALHEVRALRRYATRVLVYLYYALDNRPPHYRMLLAGVSALRKALARVRGERARSVIVSALTYAVYLPLISLGRLLAPTGLSSHVPLYDGYRTDSLTRIRQDVYDRFFTGIEQRFTKKEILGLRDTYDDVQVSTRIPYWHFLCSSGSRQS